ncbi:Putative SOS response-associated peptidase YedK [Flaviramulus basaltis]|uniref:Abasic site processing protein n=1 Tax=Flaviramulus basaltis TaxID=369401 RepID=A0A1K2ICW8_9FLAO|nr:SOS response-associated peptidase [Flaviramulus basaltis]SFZ89547.1 Putative SOS response-associated peptidase YedK [Flaviramulus basaltis]
MCFHTSTTHKTKKLEEHFKVTLNTESVRPIFDKPNYHLNGFAHPNMLVIPQERKEVLAPGVWGLVPSNKSSKDIKAYYKEAIKYGGGLNAQSEKLFQHYLYRESAMTRRCTIPVTGFFEPHDHNKKKYPFFIQAKEKQPLALAGIYTVIDTYITFTILTKAASPLFEKIHNLKKRQPVILDAALTQNWLDPELKQEDIKELIHMDYPENKLEAHTVSKDLFSPKVDSNVQTIVEKVSYTELQGFI